MRAVERWVLTLWPWAALLLSGILYWVMLPEHTEIQSWIFGGMEVISYPVWFLSGGLLGIVFSAIWSRWPNSITTGARRVALIIFAYIGIAIIIALITGEGQGIERIGNSGPVKVWGFMVWTILSMGPSLMGVLAILHRSKWARGIAILSYISTATAAMIYSQASRGEIISQDPFISILFIWAIIAYVEGMNWQTRYLDSHEESASLLWRRQASFTMVFLIAGSIIAYLPYLLTGVFINVYESHTIMGKGFIGALFLIPLAGAAIIKSIIENRSKI